MSGYKQDRARVIAIAHKRAITREDSGWLKLRERGGREIACVRDCNCNCKRERTIVCEKEWMQDIARVIVHKRVITTEATDRVIKIETERTLIVWEIVIARESNCVWESECKQDRAHVIAIARKRAITREARERIIQMERDRRERLIVW